MIRVLCWLGLFVSFAAWAEMPDPLQLLQYMRQNGSSQFAYTETRQLELAASPWLGQGYMLSDAEGSLVKLQLNPGRIVMAIAHDQMYYWDAQQQQRHAAPLTDANVSASQIKLFRAILQGDSEQLQSLYNLSSEQQGTHWILRLTPKSDHSGDEIPSFEISGDTDNQLRRIMIRQADGEYTEYRLRHTHTEQEPVFDLQSLLREAVGD